LYFNTTEKKTKVYSNSAWGDLGGGALGLLPSYTTTQRNALSPATGQQIYNTTENKVQVYGSGNWIAVSAKLALAATCTLDGDCDSTHCVDSVCCDTVCTGTVCQTCGSLSSAGLGYCGYVNNSSQDPRNTCTTATPGAADSCKSPNCSGTGYSCPYLAAGEQGQPVCKRCSGSSYNPVNIANTLQDAEGPSYLCTATHYRCDGSGNCTAPTGAQVCRDIGMTTETCAAARIRLDYASCVNTYNNQTCSTTAYACTVYIGPGYSSSCTMIPYVY